MPAEAYRGAYGQILLAQVATALWAARVPAVRREAPSGGMRPTFVLRACAGELNRTAFGDDAGPKLVQRMGPEKTVMPNSAARKGVMSARELLRLREPKSQLP